MSEGANPFLVNSLETSGSSRELSDITENHEEFLPLWW